MREMHKEMETQIQPENINESKAEKFIRLGEYRMNKVVKAMIQLENLSNRSSYEYCEEQVDKMFEHLEETLATCKQKFSNQKKANSSFKFGEN